MSDVVDISRIRETSDGDTEFEMELIEMYLDDAQSHVDRLAAAVEAGDIAGIKQGAHTLKGSSANIGAVRMQDASLELEKCGRDGDAAAAVGLVAPLREAFAVTRTYFEDYLKTIS